MTRIDSSKINELLLELTAVPSLSNTAREREMAELITEKLKEVPYFARNSSQIYHWPLPDDIHQRSVVAALLQKGSRTETVVLLNHYDVVDVQDYDQDRELAFSPRELTAKISHRPGIKKLTGEEGEEYLFGRGVADMKAGIAIQLEVLSRLAEDKDFTGNLLFLSVPDEETSSRGMLAAVPELVELQEKEGLEYQAVINCEPAFPVFPGDRKRYIYTGSMGKAVVFFSALGLETHAGDSLSGLNGNLITAYLIKKLENNLEFSEISDGYQAPPPTCLKARDSKEYYSAKIPHAAGCYYNICLLELGADQLLESLKELAWQVLQEVLEDWQETRREYFSFQGVLDDPTEKRKGWVLTYQELLKLAREKNGVEVDQALKELIAESRETGVEDQELCLRMADLVKDYAEKTGPGIVLGFTPPYYPPVQTGTANPRDKRVQTLARNLVDRAEVEMGYSVELSSHFPGVSDLSYCKIGEYAGTRAALENNLPLWGEGYQLPLKDISRLDIPLLNISVQGYDAHKRLERLELNYSLGAVPELVEQACRNLTENK